MRIISNIESIKRRTSREQSDNWWLGSLLTVVLVLSLLFFAAERMLCSKINYELLQVMALKQELVQVSQRLHLEKVSLESPARLAQEARKLGLRPPSEEQVVPIEVR